MTTFTFSHGAWHGAWCWQLLVPELARLGHRAVPVDLPIDVPGAGAEAYADAIEAAVDGVGDDLVVVGHSLGGTAVPVVAARRPVRMMIFVTALTPVPGKSLADIAAEAPQSHARQWSTYVQSARQYSDGSNDWAGEHAMAVAAEAFYHDCPRADALDYARQLRRQYPNAFDEKTPVTTWPDVPVAAVIARGDRVLSPDWLSEQWRQRFDQEPVQLPGSHSPMCSRPAALAEVLDTLVRA